MSRSESTNTVEYVDKRNYASRRSLKLTLWQKDEKVTMEYPAQDWIIEKLECDNNGVVNELSFKVRNRDDEKVIFVVARVCDLYYRNQELLDEVFEKLALRRTQYINIPERKNAIYKRTMAEYRSYDKAERLAEFSRGDVGEDEVNWSMESEDWSDDSTMVSHLSEKIEDAIENGVEMREYFSEE